ncbi:hypothetical protein [Stenotrophomonas tumulicola]|uniref:His-Xaa-Ser system protein HxsD n=1 Tax=Stenotrophomonas tumulicola TaxID=1685415 RepID=A0A7W3FJI7_9GAMM|nr:hypothetical protein [Stenotrophomonas tumulicola]MBA8680724.1 hypothetical protein [Stenotrophomonas tumulicola]
MESSEFVIDRSLYSDEVVTRAAHRHSGECSIELLLREGNLVVVFRAAHGKDLPFDLRARLFNNLLDEKLRALVRAETQGIQQELVQAALAQARPLDGLP